MVATVVLLIAAIITAPGAMLMAYARTGEQETLGGVILMYAALVWVAGGVLWGIGL